MQIKNTSELLFICMLVLRHLGNCCLPWSYYPNNIIIQPIVERIFHISNLKFIVNINKICLIFEKWPKIKIVFHHEKIFVLCWKWLIFNLKNGLLRLVQIWTFLFSTFKDNFQIDDYCGIFVLQCNKRKTNLFSLTRFNEVVAKYLNFDIITWIFYGKLGTYKFKMLLLLDKNNICVSMEPLNNCVNNVNREVSLV